MKGLITLSAAALATFPLSAAENTNLSPLPIVGETSVGAPANPDRFTFVVAGDNRAAGRDIPMPPTANQVFSEMRLLRPAFCLWTGDSIYGTDDTPGEADHEYAAFLRDAAAAATPIFNAPGNHEIFKRRELEQVYMRAMGRLFGSFDYGRSHFIALDTEEIGRPPGIGAEQQKWLEADLDAHANAAHFFVFSHHPLFPKDPDDGFANAANRDAIHRLFVEHHVSTVFSGHEHLYYASVHDGVHYVVTGGGGAPADAAPEEGGFQHYLLVHVDGAAVTTAVLEPWRLFARTGPLQPDGACTALVTNYQFQPVRVAIDFPAALPAGEAAASATWTYKGKTHPLTAEVMPADSPGLITVTLTVPKGRAAVVTLHKRTGS